MFEHVEQEWLRKVLLGDVSEDKICQALEYTRRCLSEDYDNENVSLADLDYRFEWLEDAELAWNEEGDMMWALDSLKNVWR